MSQTPTASVTATATVPPITPPAPPKKGIGRYVAAIVLVLLLAWAFSGVQANVPDLVSGAPQMMDTLSRMLPPDTTLVTNKSNYDLPKDMSLPQLLLPLHVKPDLAQERSEWWNNSFPQTVLGAVLQTIQMALAGTFLSLLIAFPLSFFAARNTSPHPAVYHTVKLAINFFRTIPDFAVGLVLIAAVGLGAFPGTLALAFHTTTVLTKLFAESIEDIDEGVVEALKATGARRMQVLAYAVVPQVMPSFISFLLYRFETNIRAAAVLGLIGAGGIGFIMMTDFRMFQYPQAAMTVLVLIVLVMVVDYMSARLRLLVT
ncbi:MAG TPA: phosphonate ABC transporter, permease protein PhnE [Oscillatoriaceae cyanobacterium]